jgi:tetratricopeptide (TPR) repeat protein
MTDELITHLAKISSLRVTSRTSVMRYKGVSKPVSQIARELNVDAIVEGSVLRDGDRVRIAAQLIDPATDRHMWAETYEQDIGDILALQSSVARAIAQEIDVKLTPQEKTRLAESPHVNSEAYELYLQGRYFWNQRTPDGLRKGLEYFQRAIAEDPGFALAYSGLADSYVSLCDLEVLEANVAGPEAKAAAEKALELDDKLAEAHASLGIASLYDHLNWRESEKELKLAIALNPNYASAYQWYAGTLEVIGRPEDLVNNARRAQELDPLSPIINAYLGRAYYLARRYDDAIQQCQRTLQVDPGFPVAHLYLGMVYSQKGRHKEAIAEMRKAGSLSQEAPLMVAVLGFAYAAAGKKGEASRILRELLEPPKRKFVSSADIAIIYAGMGEIERAFQWLEKAQEEGSLWSISLKLDPKLDSLRADPRFADLLRRAGLPPD